MWVQQTSCQPLALAVIEYYQSWKINVCDCINIFTAHIGTHNLHIVIHGAL